MQKSSWCESKQGLLDEEIGLPNDAIIDLCLDMLGFLREKPE